MGAEGGVHWGRIEVWLGVAWERLGCGCGCGWGSPGSCWGCIGGVFEVWLGSAWELLGCR